MLVAAKEGKQNKVSKLRKEFVPPGQKGRGNSAGISMSMSVIRSNDIMLGHNVSLFSVIYLYTVYVVVLATFATFIEEN